MSVFHPVAAAATATATESIFTPYYLFILLICLTCLVCGTARKLSSPASLFHPPVCSKQVHMSRLASYQCGSSANYYEQENKKVGVIFVDSNSAEFNDNYNTWTRIYVIVVLYKTTSFAVKQSFPQFGVLGEHQLHTLTLTYWQYLPPFTRTHIILSFFLWVSSMWKDRGRSWSRSLNDLQAKNINLWNDFTDSEVGTFFTCLFSSCGSSLVSFLFAFICNLQPKY